MNSVWGLESGIDGEDRLLKGFRGMVFIPFINTTVLAIGLFVQRRSYTNSLDGWGTANADLAGDRQHGLFQMLSVPGGSPVSYLGVFFDT